jgi:excisionase family DNA binding protein
MLTMENPLENEGRGKGPSAVGNDGPPYRSHEVAERLNISEKCAIDAAKKGRLRATKFARLWLFNREQVDRLARGEPA